MVAYWAAAKTGLVIVPMSPLLQDGGLVSLLGDSDSRAGAGSCLVRRHLRSAFATGCRRSPPTAGSWSASGGERARLPDLRGVPRRGLGGQSAGCRADRRRLLQHHVLERHHRPAQGHRPHPLRPRHVLHAVRPGLPDHPGERGPARRLDRLQRRDGRPDAVDVRGRHLHPARELRRRPGDRGHRRLEGHPHHPGAGADHRHPRAARPTRRRS